MSSLSAAQIERAVPRRLPRRARRRSNPATCTSTPAVTAWRWQQFEASAVAAAPFLAAAGEKVGVRILRAVEASFAAAGCNTNLGILLLCAPLAAAAETPLQGPLRDRLRVVLNSFDDEDAAAVFAAIRTANPGGLGSVPEQDVADARRPSGCSRRWAWPPGATGSRRPI